MAAEHIYKMLLAENKKRKRMTLENRSCQLPRPKRSARQRPSQVRSEVWLALIAIVFFSTYLLEIAGVCSRYHRV